MRRPVIVFIVGLLTGGVVGLGLARLSEDDTIPDLFAYERYGDGLSDAVGPAGWDVGSEGDPRMPKEDEAGADRAARVLQHRRPATRKARGRVGVRRRADPLPGR